MIMLHLKHISGVFVMAHAFIFSLGSLFPHSKNNNVLNIEFSFKTRKTYDSITSKNVSGYFLWVEETCEYKSTNSNYVDAWLQKSQHHIQWRF